jgi:putative transposase
MLSVKKEARPMARKQNCPIKLTDSEREELQRIVRTGQCSARVRRRAQTLLWSDSGKTDTEIAQLHGVRPLTVATTRRWWVEEKRLTDKAKPGREKKLDGKQEAFLVALACSAAPEGRESWTMQLLADRLVELKVIDEPISDETVRRTLKKMNFSPGAKNSGASPQ